MKTIGIQRTSYPEIRNITSLNQDRAVYRVIPSQFPDDPAIAESLNKSGLFTQYATYPSPSEPIDCYHTFNSIPLNNIPFVCSYEASIPRWWGVDEAMWRRGVDRLCSDDCRRLFAISNWALELTRSFLARFGQDAVNIIMDKTELLYPPQSLPASIYPAKFTQPAQLIFTYVGGDFYRKGGYEFICAMEKILKSGAPVKVNLVANLTPRNENYPWNLETDKKAAHARTIIGQYPGQTNYHQRLDTKDVLQLFHDSHVAVLPSYHDTFGFSVLEAQSNYCPVITTNQRAFPEINDDEIGWVIPLPLDKQGQTNVNAASFEFVSNQLKENLVHIIQQIIDSPESLQKKASLAHERIQTVHCPTLIGDRIYRWY